MLPSSFTTSRISVLAGILLAGSLSFAGIGPANDWTIHQAYESPRAIGMGGAFTSVADDDWALFYNPAGLARLTQGDANFALGVGGSPGAMSFEKDLRDAAKQGSSAAVDVANILHDHYGDHYSARATTSFMYARKGWGFAIIPADVSVDMQIEQQLGPVAAIVATNDTTVAYGRGWTVYKGRAGLLSVGATARAVYRLYVNKNELATDYALDSDIFNKSDLDEGFGVDGDVGLLYSIVPSGHGILKWLNPTIGLAIRNIADSGFSHNFHLIDKNTGAPLKDERRFDAGLKFELPKWWVFKTRIAVEERDMGHDNWTFKKGSHIGAESLWKMKNWWQGGWRVGLNQGYWTAGFTGLIGIFQLDLVSEGQEVGPSSASQQDRRYMARASLDF